MASEMNKRARGVPLQHVHHLLLVRRVETVQRHIVWNCPLVTRGQVVDDDHVVVPLFKLVNGVGTDVTGASGHDDTLPVIQFKHSPNPSSFVVAPSCVPDRRGRRKLIDETGHLIRGDILETPGVAEWTGSLEAGAAGEPGGDNARRI